MKSGLSLRDPDYEIDRNLTLAESVDLIAVNTPVVFPPGTQLDYEGDGMQVVGRICEVATGKDWRVSRELLFDPLGMDSADYLFFGSNPGIAGGARCSATDYLKFLHMVLRMARSRQRPGGSIKPQRAGVFHQPDLRPAGILQSGAGLGLLCLRRAAGLRDGSWVIAQHPLSGVVEEVASPARSAPIRGWTGGAGCAGSSSCWGSDRLRLRTTSGC